MGQRAALRQVSPLSAPTPRLALFLPALEGGGAERGWLALSEEFARRGVDVDLVTANSRGPLRPYVPGTVRHVDLGSASTVAAVPALWRYLRDVRPAVLLSALTHANAVAVVAGYRTRTTIVVSEQNTIPRHVRYSPIRKDRLLRVAALATYRSADAIVCSTAGVADDLGWLAGGPRAQVIPNPVVTDSLLAMRGAPRPPLLGDPSTPTIVTAGRLTPQKDFPTLLEAVALLRPRVPVKLVIMGEGPDRLALERMARERGVDDIVTFAGFVPARLPVIANASVFVLSSRFEGLGNVVVEALALGVPTVATDCPHGPGEVLAGGRYGWLVPVGDASALARSIGEAIAAPRVVPPDSAWRRYHVSSVADRYLELFSEIRVP